MMNTAKRNMFFLKLSELMCEHNVILTACGIGQGSEGGFLEVDFNTEEGEMYGWCYDTTDFGDTVIDYKKVLEAVK